jgi:23S rRNA (uridine2552-2'-O)-methyltransferase
MPAERLLEPVRDRDATRRFDVVLSDMAPNTSGHGDDLVSSRLCRGVLDLVPRVLRVGGWLAMKILEGAEYSAVLEETAGLFGNAKGLKPRATREISREMYIIGIGFRGAEGKAPPTRGLGAPPSPRAGWS